MKKKGPLNAMNVFSGLGASSERSEPHDKSGDDSRSTYMYIHTCICMHIHACGTVRTHTVLFYTDERLQNVFMDVMGCLYCGILGVLRLHCPVNPVRLVLVVHQANPVNPVYRVFRQLTNQQSKKMERALDGTQLAAMLPLVALLKVATSV